MRRRQAKARMISSISFWRPGPRHKAAPGGSVTLSAELCFGEDRVNLLTRVRLSRVPSRQQVDAVLWAARQNCHAPVPGADSSIGLCGWRGKRLNALPGTEA